MSDPRKPAFDAARAASLDHALDAEEVAMIHAALDAIGFARSPAALTAASADFGRKVGTKGIALMHRWEGCKLAAYPDPGSRDGNPWTIGWGATGPGIRRGTVWTQVEADARFERDIVRYARDVEKALAGAPTSQEQFDALVAFHYNTGAIFKATLTAKHRKGDFAGAAAEFGKWVFNDGKKMPGLVNRRKDEAQLYRSGS